MSEKQIVEMLMRSGRTEKEAEEMYDFYLSIDCLDGLSNLTLVETVLRG